MSDPKNTLLAVVSTGSGFVDVSQYTGITVVTAANPANAVVSFAGALSAVGGVESDTDELKFSTNTAGFVLVADGNKFAPVNMSGDASISSAGVVSFGCVVFINADIKSDAAIAFSKMENLTNSRALVSNGSGDVSVSDVTSTEIGYLDGVSSNLQTQLDAKHATIDSSNRLNANLIHDGTISNTEFG